MNYTEAIDYAKAGHRIRRRGWNDESYGRWVKDELRAYIGNRKSTCAIQDFDRDACDWQVLPARSAMK